MEDLSGPAGQAEGQTLDARPDVWKCASVEGDLAMQASWLLAQNEIQQSGAGLDGFVADFFGSSRIEGALFEPCSVD